VRRQRVWTLHRGEYAAALLEAVPGIGAEVVHARRGELRKTRLFRSHEQAMSQREVRRCARIDSRFTHVRPAAARMR
jgi:hypothetical protein